MAKEKASNPENKDGEANKVATDEREEKPDRRRKQVAKKKSKNVLTCVVFSLDGTELTIEVEKNAPGEVLFSKVVENLDVVDKEYFGLSCVNAKTSSKCWLNLHKSIKKQFGTRSLEFQFAVKFYEPEPGRHLDEYTRYLLYLQLREDIVYGRLHCPTRTYVLLGSFTAQSEFGDYNPVDHGHTYLDDYQLGPEEVENEPKFLQRVIDLHREHRGQTPAETELNFLEVAKRTPRYGIDVHFAKDKKGDQVEVGVCHKGIILFKDGDAYDSFGWRAIDVVTYKRKKFMLKLFPSEKRKNPRFATATKRDAKNLYKSAIEHHSFFRLPNPDPARRKSEMFIIGSKFRYSDRTLYQIRSSPGTQERPVGGSFSRSPSKRQKSLKHKPVKRQLQPVPAEKVPEEKEPGVEYEEIEIDESKPDDAKYNTEEWEIIEKVLPDGTKKRYRRRIVTTTTTTTKTYVIRKGTEEIGHVLEDKPIVGSPVEEETEISEEKRVSPVEEPEREDEHRHEEIVTTTIITEEIVTKPEKKVEEPTEEVNNQGPMSMAELRASSKKPSAAVKPLMREDLESEQTTTTTTTKKVLVYDVDKEETMKIISQEERERELRQRELEQFELRKREEQRLREEREEILRRQREEEDRMRREQEEFERRQLELQEEEEKRRLENMSPQFEEITLATGNPEFDKEFNIMPDTFLIKSSPLPTKIIAEIDDEIDYGREEKKEEDYVDSLDVKVEDTRKVKTLDRKFVRRPPPERSSGYIRRSYGDELDFDYSPGQGARTMPRKMRKYVPLITKEELVRAYSSGGLHDESVTSTKQEEEEAERSQIEYSLKDTSGVEQGASGFVKSLIGRHETIKREKDEEIDERRRSRVYSTHEDEKGVVPTRSASFANVDRPETKKTRVPPPVKTKPVVFHPNTSDEAAIPEVTSPANIEITVQAPDSTDRRHPEENNPYNIPEVVTTSMVYTEQAAPVQHHDTGHIDSEAVERLWGKRTTKGKRSIKEKTELSVSDADYRKRKICIADELCSKVVFNSKNVPCCIVNELAPEVLLEPNGFAENMDKSTADKKKSANEDTMQMSALEPILVDDVIAVSPKSQKVKGKECGSRCKNVEQKFPCVEDDLGSIIVEESTSGFDWSAVKPLCNGNDELEVFDNNKVLGYIVNELIPEEVLEPKGVVAAASCEKSVQGDETETAVHLQPLQPIQTDDIIAVSPEPQKINGEKLDCDSHGNEPQQKDPCLEDDLMTMIVEDRIEEFDWSVVKPLCNGNDELEVFDNNKVLGYIVNELVPEEVFEPKGVVAAVSCEKSVQGDETETAVHLQPLQPIQTDDIIAVSPQKINGEKLECDSDGNESQQKDPCLEDDLMTMIVEDSIEGFDWSVVKPLCNGNDVTEMEVGICDRKEAVTIIESETTQAKKGNDENEEQKGFESEERVEVVNQEDEEGSPLVNETELDSDETFMVEKELELDNKESSMPERETVFEKHEDTDDKAKTDINSNTVLLKPVTDTQTLKRKKFSEADGEPNSKRINVSNDKELGRLKKEYDTILADFWRHRSNSFGEETGIVPTKNISVIPAEPPASHPPPPDVITHSETTTTTTANARESCSSEGFPSPPPDLVTQTIITPHPTNATYIETKEVMSTRMLPPEIETRTVVIGGDDLSKEEIDRLMREGMVSTSETTITKTSVMTTQQRVEKTIVTEQSTVVAEDGNVLEEML